MVKIKGFEITDNFYTIEIWSEWIHDGDEINFSNHVNYNLKLDNLKLVGIEVISKYVFWV